MRNNKPNKTNKKPNPELAKAKKYIYDRRLEALKTISFIPAEQVPDYIIAGVSDQAFEALCKRREQVMAKHNLSIEELITNLVKAEIRCDQLLFSYNRCLKLLEENGKHIAELHDYNRLRSISGGLGKKEAYRKNFEIIKNLRIEMTKKNGFLPTADEIIDELQSREIGPLAPAKDWSIETISDYIREIKKVES